MSASPGAPVLRLGLRLRLWGWGARLRVAEQHHRRSCAHDGTPPLCWACVLLCCRYP